MRLRLAATLVAACAALVSSAHPFGLRGKINARDGLNYKWLPAGHYVFGCSPTDEECFAWEKKPVQVSVKGFWIGTTEVTQEAYLKVMGRNPSLYRGDKRPVDRVSWDDAHQFCESAGMRLPTELEWEYAARGGNGSARYGRLDDIAWYDGNSGDQTHDVAQKLPNAFGLYDTLGNVWEWVQDTFEAEPEKKMLRGDSFYNTSRQVRVSDRLWAKPDTAHRDMGFRCAGD